MTLPAVGGLILQRYVGLDGCAGVNVYVSTPLMHPLGPVISNGPESVFSFTVNDIGNELQLGGLI